MDRLARARAALLALPARLKGRSDSEHEQAIIRFVIVFVAATYFYLLHHEAEFGNEAYQQSVLVVGAYLLLSVIYIGLIVASPAPSPARRLAAMVTDYFVLSLLMHLGEEAGTPLYLLYLWITFGYGFRYGVAYLALAALVSILGFLWVILSTAYWQGQPYLAAGLLAALVILPAYVSTLIRKLTLAKAQAEEASQAKTRFLASMSHELRTPLNAIIGISELLQGTRLDREQQDMTRTVGTSGRALLSLIEDILDVSKIEAGEARRDAVAFDLHAELADLLSILRPQAEAGGLRLLVHVGAAVPYRLHGDRQHLRQIITNLLANAIKFTQRGHVMLRVEASALSEGLARLRFEVSDSGIGIPASEHERIFESFAKIDEATNRQYGGTGLGLSITKQLCDLMGGSIALSSEVGVGSRFTVTLEIERPPDEGEAPRPQLGRLLLLSHDRDLRRRLGEAVRLQGGDLVHVESEAQAGGLLAQSHQRQERYAAVLIDRSAPTSGDAALLASSIRAFDPLSEQPFVLLLEPGAAEPSEEETQAFLTALNLPLAAGPLDNVLHCIAAFDPAQRTIREDARLRAAQAGIHRRLRILIAEDNAVNRMVTAKILQRAGHLPVLAETGDEALDTLEAQDFDAVLMDINMPGTSGLDAVRLYRFANSDRPHLPFIALTADATPENRERCEAVGMDDIITKPVDSARLLETIHACIAGRAPAAAPDSSPREKAADDRVADIASHPLYLKDEEPALDLRALRNIESLDPSSDFLGDVLGRYMADSEQVLRAMAGALERHNVRRIREGAHALRSSSANVGAQRMHRLCSELCGINGLEMDRVADAKLRALNQEFARFRAAVDAYLSERQRRRPS